MCEYEHVLWILLCIIQLEKSKSTAWEHVCHVNFSLGQHSCYNKYVVLNNCNLEQVVSHVCQVAEFSSHSGGPEWHPTIEKEQEG